MNNTAAIKEYLDTRADPKGAWCRAIERSFRRSQEVDAALVASISAKYKVDPQVLVRAELSQRASLLCKPGGWRDMLGR